jgi:hypothetical protein
MGANAQTSVPAFTTGQVLTAQQQTEINTGVPVFATTTTRDAAFGGTGEKVLAEGQLAYIEASDVVQYYNGSTWATLAPTSSALTYITGATIGAVSSVSLANNTFTSTYRHYLITVDCEFSTNSYITIRMRASGSDNSNSTYNWGTSNTNTAGTVAGQGTATDTSWRIAYGASATNRSASLQIMVYSPQAAVVTRYGSYGFSSDNSFNATAAVQSGGVFTATTSFDALSLIGSFASGTYRVYGLADS